jgi:hypothetical protein
MTVSWSAACETLLLQLLFHNKDKRRRTPIVWYESRTISESLSSRKWWVFPSRNFARIEEREGRCLRIPCRSRPCTGDRQLSFWGASTWLPKHLSLSSSPVNIFFFLVEWQEKLVKDLNPRNAWEGMIVSSPYYFTFSRLYMFRMFMSTVSYVTMNLSHLFCHIILCHVWCWFTLVICYTCLS